VESPTCSPKSFQEGVSQLNRVAQGLGLMRASIALRYCRDEDVSSIASGAEKVERASKSLRLKSKCGCSEITSALICPPQNANSECTIGRAFHSQPIPNADNTVPFNSPLSLIMTTVDTYRQLSSSYLQMYFERSTTHPSPNTITRNYYLQLYPLPTESAQQSPPRGRSSV